MAWYDWVPFAGTVNHLTKSPKGIYPEDYIGCAITPADCVEGDPVANAPLLRQCEACVARLLAQYSADWAGLDGYVKDAVVDILGVVAAIRGALLLKAGVSAGVAWTGIGLLFLADGLLDMYVVFKKLDQMKNAAQRAKSDYCRCP